LDVAEPVFGVKAEATADRSLSMSRGPKMDPCARDSSLERARLALSTKMATSLARSRVQRLASELSFRLRLPRVEITANAPAIQTFRAGFRLRLEDLERRSMLVSSSTFFSPGENPVKLIARARARARGETSLAQSREENAQFACA